jgi:hypothetical protein
MIKVGPKEARAVTAALKGIPQVRVLHSVSGDIDLIAVAATASVVGDGRGHRSHRRARRRGAHHLVHSLVDEIRCRRSAQSRAAIGCDFDLQGVNKKRRGPFEPTPPDYRTDGGVGWLAGARCS